MAGAIFVVMFTLTQNKWKIDDVLGVWPLHGLCGTWGGVAAGLFGSKALGGLGGVACRAKLLGTAMGVAWALTCGLVVYAGLKASVGPAPEPGGRIRRRRPVDPRIGATPDREVNWCFPHPGLETLAPDQGYLAHTCAQAGCGLLQVGLGRLVGQNDADQRPVTGHTGQTRAEAQGQPQGVMGGQQPERGHVNGGIGRRGCAMQGPLDARHIGQKRLGCQLGKSLHKLGQRITPAGQVATLGRKGLPEGTRQRGKVVFVQQPGQHRVRTLQGTHREFASMAAVGQQTAPKPGCRVI
jgi:hypothetical protein